MIKYQNISESKFELDVPGGKKISGFLRGSLEDDSPVVVMMHGRPGHANELLQYLGARYLYENGISSLRLSMYDFGPHYRSILDCTLDTHISDFETVVEYLRKQNVKKVFALGHSYGGITILGSKAHLEGAVLWDPAHGLAWRDPVFNNPNYPEKTFDDIVIGLGGAGYINPTTQETYDLALGDTTNWAKNKGYPMQFILAEAGPLAAYARRYYDVASQPKALVEIPTAHHQFEDSDEVVEQLFKETTSWVKQWC